ncbi:TAP-like protein-domain-containing protein [Lophiotrema nucula]|uniref:TAP-like protein-domain-containing protein n=1 Tax=Lophiotrema nucula TaxID=690887 RepID=A0A6A5ZMB1_9PLEO|nr:TAP-like protein-domain-containing protein [Lophiotrema nucula]
MLRIIDRVLVAYLCLSTSHAASTRRRDNGALVTSFDQVPLDYEDLSAGTTEIAFIKKDAEDPSAEDILINPGGPSNSGVQFLLAGASLIEQNFGSQYNLIGFDPRGVNNSGPTLTCFPESEAAQTVFGHKLGLPIDSNSSSAIATAYELAGGWGQWCTRANTKSGAQYANTPAVAADLLHFIKLRQEGEINGGKPSEVAMLRYYGLSYGSIIGTTFASLYPENVGRMILDAPIDMEDYYTGQSRQNLDDADATVKAFFKYCHAAGPDACALYEDSEEGVETRFRKVLQDTINEPLVVVDPYFVQMPTVASYQALQSIILQATFAPISRFPALAQLFVGLERGNGSAVAKSSGFGTLTTASAGETKSKEYHMEEPRLIILCNDANGRSNLSSIAAFEKQVEYLVDQSHYLGESWAGATGVNCHSLDLKSPKSQQFSGLPSLASKNKSAPILFLSNTIDPTSPLQGAKKMTELFPGSALVTVEGVGHGTVTAPSKCAMEYIQSYLAWGTIPLGNATCKPDSVPFVGKNGGWGTVLHPVY